MKKKVIKAVDHDTIDYMPSGRFLHAGPRNQRFVKKGRCVDERKDEVRVRVRSAPRRYRSEHCGLSSRMMAVARHHRWMDPFAIQKQALPVIMSGRDCIAGELVRVDSAFIYAIKARA